MGDCYVCYSRLCKDRKNVVNQRRVVYPIHIRPSKSYPKLSYLYLRVIIRMSTSTITTLNDNWFR